MFSCTNPLCELHDPNECDDETESCVDCHIAQLESENEQLKERAMELFRQDIEIAAQRRTIATLRARLAYKAQGYQEDVCFLGDRFNQYRRVGNEFRKHDLRGLHEVRIAAIRNFGALP